MTLLRGALGEVQWAATQTMPKYQAECSMLQSSGPTATIETIFQINKLIRRLRCDQQYELHYQNCGGQDMVLAAWSDAAWANRPDGSRQADT